jgi:hypothetical protein
VADKDVMDSSRLARTVAMAAMAAAIVCPAAADAATTRYVKQGGVNSGSCLTPAPPAGTRAS